MRARLSYISMLILPLLLAGCSVGGGSNSHSQHLAGFSPAHGCGMKRRFQVEVNRTKMAGARPALGRPRDSIVK